MKTLLVFLFATSVAFAQTKPTALKDASNVDPATWRNALDVPSTGEVAGLIPDVDNAAVNEAIAENPSATRDAAHIGYLVTAWSADFPGISYTATVPGPSTSDITVAHVLNGNANATPVVTVTGRAISINAGANITTSAIATAVAGNAQAAALVTATVIGSGASPYIAKSATNLTSPLSTYGGTSKILQYNSYGDIETGTTNNNVIMGLGGNIIMPNKRGLTWRKADGSQSGYFICPVEDHDSQGGELFIESPWRIAFLAKGPIQVGRNDAMRFPTCFEMTTGAATATDQTKPSYSINYMTKMWNGGSPLTGSIIQQAWPVAANSDVSTLRTYARGIVSGKDGGAPEATTGNATGTLISELAEEGTWTPGLAPAFVALPDNGTSVTQACSKYKSVQMGSVQLGGDRTLVIDNKLPGMRGVIFVKQDGSPPRTLTLPEGSATPAGWALSTAAYAVDRLAWEFDGLYTYWSMVKGITLPPDADASAFLARASISDATQMTAVNNLVLSLKGAGLWDLLDCIYPFVGANAVSHSKNLKSNTYNITWVGGVTHTDHATGTITGNGTTGYGLTGYAISAAGGQNSVSGGAYCRTALPTPGCFFFGTSKTNGNFGLWRSSNGIGEILWCFGPNSANTGDPGFFPATSGNPDFRTHMYISRRASNDWVAGLSGPGGTSLLSRTSASTGVSDYPIAILGISNSASNAVQVTNANLAMVWLGRGMSDAQLLSMDTIVQSFQTALGRANP